MVQTNGHTARGLVVYRPTKRSKPRLRPKHNKTLESQSQLAVILDQGEPLWLSESLLATLASKSLEPHSTKLAKSLDHK